MTTPTERPTRPRIDPIDEPDDELAEILKGALLLDGKPLNIFGVLGNHPKLLKRFNLLAGFLLNKGPLPPREREIVILRIGWNARAVYEFGQHTLMGRDAVNVAGGMGAWLDAGKPAKSGAGG